MIEKNNQWPQSWYPVCTSADVPCGKIVEVSLFDNNWIVFRGSDGNIGVVEKYCCHMGTDLTNGQVIVNRLRCPLHHWEFGYDGKCEKIPAYKNIPEKAKNKSLITKEKYGIIFVFWGSDAYFEFPEITLLKYPVQATAKKMELNGPAEAIILNAFDAQHFYCVHNRAVLDEPKVTSKHPHHLAIQFSASVLTKNLYDYAMKLLGLKILNVSIELWGSNLLWVHNKSGKYVAFLALLPVNDKECVLFLNVVREERTGIIGKLLQHFELPFYNWIAQRFLEPDIPVVQGMIPLKGVLLEDRDSSVFAFWDYWEKLPTASKDFLEE